MVGGHKVKVMRRLGMAALLSVVLGLGANAATTSVEMLRELFRLPPTEWRQQLKSNSRLLDDEFFTNVEKRVRWGIENNHVDDAFRFAMVGDFASEAVKRPANFRIEIAELFFKAENLVMAGQIVDNIMITSPDTIQARQAQFLRGRLYEMQKDLFNAYNDFKALADVKYEPAQTWYKAGQISLLIGEEPRGKEEMTKAAAAGSREAGEYLAKLEQINNQDWTQLPAIPNSTDNGPVLPNSTTASTDPTGTSGTAVVTSNDPLAVARLAAADGRLDEAVAAYRSLLAVDAANLAVMQELSAILYRTGELLAAKAIADQGLAGHPQDVALLRYRANISERMFDREGRAEDLRAALADYRQAVALSPGHEFLTWELSRAESKN